MKKITAKRLVQLRTESHRTQIMLIDKLGIGQTTYSNYEMAKHRIPWDILAKLAVLYHTSTDYLTGFTDERKQRAVFQRKNMSGPLMTQRLTALREEQARTRTDVGKLLGVSTKTYSNYEKQNRQIPLHLMAQLALQYHTNLDYILGLTDDPTPYPRTNRYS